MNHPIMFLDGDNKTKLAPVSLYYFLQLLCEKIKFQLKKFNSYNLYNISAV